MLPVGFTEPPQSPGVLVVSYTAVSPLPFRGRAVCFLWHCPAGHPGWALPTTVLCEVRTFLSPTEVGPRSPGRLVRRDSTNGAGSSVFEERKGSVMADDQWWFDLKTKSAVRDSKVGRSVDRLGPYRSREEAERALEKVEERNEAYDNDPRWNDDV